MGFKRIYILILVIGIIIISIYFLNQNGVGKNLSQKVLNISPRISSEEKSMRYELAKEITTPDGFINTADKSITISEFIGKKVILVDFWTYSCINCQRTTPYLNSWYEKYQDDGLVIIGIHTPEFEFEKNYNNVKVAVEKFGIKFPVVLDNDYSTWIAYKNRYWPRKYLIDIDGYIIYDHIGEGAYEETEMKIQEALQERMLVLNKGGNIEESLTKDNSVRIGHSSPETYFGSDRNDLFINGKSNITGKQNNLQIPSQINLNSLYLGGDWDIQEEFAENKSQDASIVYRYEAQSVFFVAKADSEITIEVFIDGKPLGKEMGEDIVKTFDGKTILKIKEPRLYKIIQHNQSEGHILEMKIMNPGLQAFTFTFG